MSEVMAGRCPSCGAQASGKFCSQCGASVQPQTCSKCGAQVASGARFCASCGAAAGAASTPLAAPAPAGGGRNVVPFAVAGVAVLIFALTLAFRSQPATPAAAAPVASQSGGLPDLSTMTPRDAFNRLFTRVMTASEQGDSATANRFVPMALMAYRNLPEVDIDARYDVALIHLHVGDIQTARALADTIQREQARHLFGFVLRAAIARFDNQPAAAKAAYRDFLAQADTELQASRPEYDAHRSMLENFRQTAINETR